MHQLSTHITNLKYHEIFRKLVHIPLRTCKNHEFIPGGENIVMNFVSGGASENLLIQQKETVLSIEHIMPGSFYTCFYDDEWYFGVVNYVSVL